MLDNEFELIKKMLIRDEAVRFYPYDDATGDPVDAPVGKITIGIGHNLQDTPIPESVIDILFQYDLDAALETCRSIFSGFDIFPTPRKLALVNMAYNLGFNKLRGFHLMIEAINDGDWLAGAREAQRSQWFFQVKDRGHRVVKMMQTNEIPQEYQV